MEVLDVCVLDSPMAIKKIHNGIKDVDLIMIFTTIHFKNKFESLLTRVRRMYPYATIIGCTVGGFISNEGLYVKGAVIVFIRIKNSLFIPTFSKNTKTNPKRCVKVLKDNINSDLLKLTLKHQLRNKLFLNFIAGPTIPKLRISMNVIKSSIVGSIASNFILPLLSYLGHGVGKEDEIIDEMDNVLYDNYIFGGSSVDDGRMFENYQFFNDLVLKNSIVGVEILTNKDINITGGVCGGSIWGKLRVTKTSFNGRVIKKINNLPAKSELLKLLGIPEEYYHKLDAFYYKISDYFPITFEENPEYTSGVAGLLGNNVVLGYRIRGYKLHILSVAGKNVLESISRIVEEHSKKSRTFVLGIASLIYLFVLGRESLKIKEIMDNYFSDSRYLILFLISENLGMPKAKKITRVYSFNLLSID